MATINAVIVPAKALKGGRHKIRIAVAHNGETRYIVTDITLDSEKQFKNGSVVKRDDAAYINTKLRGLLSKYQSALDSIPYADGYTCSELVYQMKNVGVDKHRTLQSLADEYFASRTMNAGSRMAYNTVWNRIAKFTNTNIAIENINVSTVLLFYKKLNSQNLKPSTIVLTISFFRMLWNYAKKCGYNVAPVNPFVGITLPHVEPRESWLSIEEIKKIRDVKIASRYVSFVRDLFMLSYYLGGINAADLVRINFNESGDVLHYERYKTRNRAKINKYVEFEIPEEAKEILARIKDRSGVIKKSEGDKKRAFSNKLRYFFPKLREATGIKNLVFYSARKSWSQHAFDLGIKESVIDYVLGHTLGKGGSSLYKYIYVTPEMATEAIRKVLDNLK